MSHWKADRYCFTCIGTAFHAWTGNPWWSLPSRLIWVVPIGMLAAHYFRTRGQNHVSVRRSPHQGGPLFVGSQKRNKHLKKLKSVSRAYRKAEVRGLKAKAAEEQAKHEAEQELRRIEARQAEMLQQASMYNRDLVTGGDLDANHKIRSPLGLGMYASRGRQGRL